ncbi:TetR/AcrR family transcriptional regulator [Nocardia sp. NPDC005998]|uniref:TetR/AcrR family transcriptional regulator n=1 Tax=Nocardia sp. NPDC005998 TaxID=3156894 RepID=UPI0033B40808
MTASDTRPDRRKSYHHGALRSTLIETSVALARAGGPDRVVLREVARAAGVSHSAAYRHFADREALLAEVSRYARAQLGAEMRRRIDQTDDVLLRLGAVGAAYIDFALSEPGLFRCAFVSHPVAAGDPPAAPSTDDAAPEPFTILGQVLDEAVHAGLMRSQRRPGAEIAAWSAVHGLAVLLVDGPLPDTPPAVAFAVDQVLTLIANGLLNQTDT